MRYKYLDVLKAFAIIAVVLYHSGMFQYGYLGVDIFLVISGYLTTKTLKNKLLGDSGFNGGDYLQFEISRVARLLPLLLIAGVFCMIYGYYAMLPDDYENLSESVIATNVFGNNILSAITTKNYWDVSNDYKPLMHTWYAGVLMQFYLVYPILFILAKLDRKTTQRTLLAMISSLAFVSLLVFLGTTNAAHRFYYLPSRFFEFAAGGIVALTWKPKEGERVFHTWFVYLCYVLLLALMSINRDIIPANLMLISVVALTVVIIMSNQVLENKVTANGILAKVGAASYSIFVWHQVLLAFYRYTISGHFTVITYLAFLVVVGVLSYISYIFVEQKINVWLKQKKSKTVFYIATAILFIMLTGFAGYIYKNAGVVRDIPELYVSMQNKHRGMHAEYCDRGYQYDKQFVTKNPHWLVIGNSFGRDFVNVILESVIADSVEVSYMTEGEMSQAANRKRFADADRVFISTLGLREELVTEVEILCLANGLSLEQITIVGEKDFGESNGQVYAKRNQPDYFDLYIPVRDYDRFIVQNKRFKEVYGERFLDLMSYVTNEKDEVRVFTPDHHYISADNHHFSRGGAIYFGQLIDWGKYYK